MKIKSNMERCGTLQVIKEIQIEITMRSLCTHTTVATIKETDHIKIAWWYEFL